MAAKVGDILFSAQTKYQTPPSRQGWDTSMGVLTRVAEGEGVTLDLEIVNRFETNLLNTAAQGLEYIQDTGSDNIFPHLDMFHMNIEEADPSLAIRDAGDKIGYFHVGESNRGFLGAETINFPPIFPFERPHGETLGLTILNWHDMRKHLSTNTSRQPSVRQPARDPVPVLWWNSRR
jgi:D-psicose/D-tagatose/L-ribulose 3-epimerase